MRKVLKFSHTLAACGLIGGLACYMIVLLVVPHDSLEAYAQLRGTLAAVSNYILMPSLAVALVSGLLAMAVHTPFAQMRWVWVKAAMGILMFKGVLTVVGAKADYAADLAQRAAREGSAAEALDTAILHEWSTLFVVMALSVANVLLGVWRPALKHRARARMVRAAAPAPAPIGTRPEKERERRLTAA